METCSETRLREEVRLWCLERREFWNWDWSEAEAVFERRERKEEMREV